MQHRSAATTGNKQRPQTTGGDWAELLLAWYQRGARPLPWRTAPSPYRVWVSESMLQQTQAATVVPYFERFLQHFPTVHHLANASDDAVMKQWEGLGYYCRARNLLAAARIIVAEHAGCLPATAAELQRLPGIGPYTAAAIASIAFGEHVPVIDGNVLRVMARLRAIAQDIRKAAVRQAIQKELEAVILAVSPGDFNQALMELGATVCRPRAPQCRICPLTQECAAFRQNRTAELPVRHRRGRTPHYQVAVALIFDDCGKLLITKRPQHKMLGGLWELPGGKQEKGETLQQTVVREVKEETGLDIVCGRAIAPVRHAYSHFTVTLHPFLCRIAGPIDVAESTFCAEWVSPPELDHYAFPRGTRKVFAVAGVTR